MKLLAAVSIGALLIALSVALLAPHPPNSTHGFTDPSHVIENLSAFAHLYGYTRWFHPSDAVAIADWNHLAVRGVSSVLTASNSLELVQALRSWLIPIAPSITVFLADDPLPPSEVLQRPKTEQRIGVVTWRHVGVGTDHSGALGGMYSSERRIRWLSPGSSPYGNMDPESPLRVQLTPQIAAWIPLALYVDAAGTLPRTGTAPMEATDPAPAVLPHVEAIADAIVVWTLMQHFYPYHDTLETDWEDVLASVLTHIAKTGSQFSSADLKRELLVPLGDGHAYLTSSGQRRYPTGIYPICTDDGDVSVQYVSDSARQAGVLPGDRIVTVGGIPAEAALESGLSERSGSTQLRRRVAAASLGVGPEEGTFITYQLEHLDTTRYEVTLECNAQLRPAVEETEVSYVLEPDIIYVDASRARPEHAETLNELLAGARGLIVDARGYVESQWAGLLAVEPMQSMVLRIPEIALPDRERVTYRDSRTNAFPSPAVLVPRNCELVFLINESAISAAEHQLSYFVEAGLGTFVGTPTAGANGNVNKIGLPSGRTYIWTGMRVHWSSGSRFHGIGIQPDVEVLPTRAGLADSRDEALEAALEIVRQKIGAH